MVAGKVTLVSELAASGGGEAGRRGDMRACAVRGVDEEGMTGMDEGVGWFKTQVTGGCTRVVTGQPYSPLAAPGQPLSKPYVPSVRGTAPRPSHSPANPRTEAHSAGHGPQTTGTLYAVRCSDTRVVDSLLVARAMRQVEARCTLHPILCMCIACWVPCEQATLTGVLNEGALGLRSLSLSLRSFVVPPPMLCLS